jgi:hypothetical protein
LLWGLLHGLALITEHFFPVKFIKSPIYPTLVFCSVIGFWLPFRAGNLEEFKLLVSNISLTIHFPKVLELQQMFLPGIKFFIFIVALSFMIFVEWLSPLETFSGWATKLKFWPRIFLYYLITLLILSLANLNVEPHFIYFQF